MRLQVRLSKRALPQRLFCGHGHLSFLCQRDLQRPRPRVPLLDPKIGRGLLASIALNLVLDSLSLVE